MSPRHVGSIINQNLPMSCFDNCHKTYPCTLAGGQADTLTSSCTSWLSMSNTCVIMYLHSRVASAVENFCYPPPSLPPADPWYSWQWAKINRRQPIDRWIAFSIIITNVAAVTEASSSATSGYVYLLIIDSNGHSTWLATRFFNRFRFFPWNRLEQREGRKVDNNDHRPIGRFYEYNIAFE